MNSLSLNGWKFSTLRFLTSLWGYHFLQLRDNLIDLDGLGNFGLGLVGVIITHHQKVGDAGQY